MVDSEIRSLLCKRLILRYTQFTLQKVDSEIRSLLCKMVDSEISIPSRYAVYSAEMVDFNEQFTLLKVVDFNEQFTLLKMGDCKWCLQLRVPFIVPDPVNAVADSSVSIFSVYSDVNGCVCPLTLVMSLSLDSSVVS